MKTVLTNLGSGREALHQAVQQVSEQLQLNMGKVAQPLRVAVVGRPLRRGIDETLYLVGREACLRRIDMALAFITRARHQPDRSPLPRRIDSK